MIRPIVAFVAAALLVGAPHAYGLPTMVRLAYPNCSACHIAPQGARLLNRYGRGVDQAQSLRGGEYSPLDSDFSRLLNLGGRFTARGSVFPGQ